MFFDVADIFESKWSNDESGGELEVLTCGLRPSGESDGTNQRDAEVWQQYGLSSRPSGPDGDGLCQALTAEIGGKRAVVATRDTRGPACHGALNAGDVALWSVGKNAVRCNADGSIALLKQGEEEDSGLVIDKDGALSIFTPFGIIQLNADGFAVILKEGGVALSMSPKDITLLGPKCSISTGTVALGVGAAVPLGLQPTVVPTGTVSPAFAVTKPTPNIFV